MPGSWADKLSFFADDDNGVPPCCTCTWCPLHHQNYLNNWCLTDMIGSIGMPYFDKKRKLFFGLATLATLLAMVITTYGCFALSDNPSIVAKTYWTGGTVHNSTSNTDFTIYVGLRSVAYVNCKFEPGYENYGSSCHTQGYVFTSEQCQQGVAKAACNDCEAAATKLWLTAVCSCLGLILAFLGAQTRMRIIADVPIQKVLGIGSETLGTLSLVYALVIFHNSCLYPLQDSYSASDLQAQFWSGPGIYCYAVCAVSGGIRGIVHWLTPLPGRDSVCCCETEISRERRKQSQSWDSVELRNESACSIRGTDEYMDEPSSTPNSQTKTPQPFKSRIVREHELNQNDKIV